LQSSRQINNLQLDESDANCRWLTAIRKMTRHPRETFILNGTAGKSFVREFDTLIPNFIQVLTQNRRAPFP
jgi:hypothetical protein